MPGPAEVDDAMSAPGVLDVVVVGGGIIGLSVAWRAALAGLSVTVCDPSPGRAASWAAAGMLAPVTEASVAEAPLTKLGLESARRWPAFAAELSSASGMDVGFRDEGTLAVAFDNDDRRALEELARVHEALGLTSEWLAPSACRRLEPRLSPRIRGALRVDGDWQVDNRAVVGALLAAAGRAGVRFRAKAVRGFRFASSWPDVERRSRARELPEQVEPDGDDRVVGVVLDGGSALDARAVVVAAGPWTPGLAGLPAAARPPVRPVKGEILRLQGDPADPVLHHTVRGSVEGRSVYVVPRRHGEVVVGATVQEAGFDTTVRAGAVEELLRAAIDLVPAVAELALTDSRAASRPGTPDNGPVLGETPVPGLILATGHYRNGVLLAPITADAVVSVLTGGQLPDVAAPFVLGRFR
jgi:glycine oxidase